MLLIFNDLIRLKSLLFQLLNPISSKFSKKKFPSLSLSSKSKMAASTVSMAASSSLCNKLYNLQAITQIPTNHLPSLFKTKSPKPLKLEKAQNPSALHLSLLSLSYFRQFSASFDGFQVTEDSQDEPETEQEEEEEEAVEEEEEPKVAASDEAARLYVGNLPYSMTSSSLAEVFAEAGTVASAEVCAFIFFFLLGLF